MTTQALFLPGKSHGQRSPVAAVHGVAESARLKRLKQQQQSVENNVWCVCLSHFLGPDSLCVTLQEAR